MLLLVLTLLILLVFLFIIGLLLEVFLLEDLLLLLIFLDFDILRLVRRDVSWEDGIIVVVRIGRLVKGGLEFKRFWELIR